VRSTGRLTAIVLALCVGAALMYAWQRFHSFKVWVSSHGEVTSAAPEEILVMRTRGGLLEVSRIHATEVFQTRFIHTLLGMEIGETVPRIRVPVVYRYQIPLAPEWNVLRTGTEFTVVAPAVQPALPVGVDFSRMEKDASGTWMLLPFTQTGSLDGLERELSGKLAKKALMPAYLQLQREYARRTVEEFVRKWLITQSRWSTETGTTIRVYFNDEMPDALGTRART
jgi:hypothetical protein